VEGGWRTSGKVEKGILFTQPSLSRAKKNAGSPPSIEGEPLNFDALGKGRGDLAEEEQSQSDSRSTRRELDSEPDRPGIP